MKMTDEEVASGCVNAGCALLIIGFIIACFVLSELRIIKTEKGNRTEYRLGLKGSGK